MACQFQATLSKTLWTRVRRETENCMSYQPHSLVALLRSSRIHSQLSAMGCLLMLLSGCGAREPFSYVQVSGKVAYEDGSLIPVEPLVLTFIPESTGDGKICPRPGTVTVDSATGQFSAVTSHKLGDGLVPGKYRVTLGSPGARPLFPSVMSAEYGDPGRTPLEIDTANSPFNLKVTKPR
jgi:hypothetical protein